MRDENSFGRVSRDMILERLPELGEEVLRAFIGEVAFVVKQAACITDIGLRLFQRRHIQEA